MQPPSAGHAAPRGPLQGAQAAAHRARPRATATVGYLLAAVALSVSVFALVMLSVRAAGAEAPWLPAGLAACLLLLAAAAAREVFMRRRWARRARAAGGAEHPRILPPARRRAAPGARPGWRATVAAIRGLQQRLAELDSAGTPPGAHLDAYRLCGQYLAGADELLRGPGGTAELRVALRSGQERLRALQKKHLLGWARGEATRLASEAQRRVRHADKVETAERALGVLEEALRAYPDEPELRESAAAVRDFVASVRVGRWVEMAERAAFRGKYGRAVARYRDALFYLSRAEMGEEARAEAEGRISREIEILRAHISAARPRAAGRRGAARDGGTDGGREP